MNGRSASFVLVVGGAVLAAAAAATAGEGAATLAAGDGVRGTLSEGDTQVFKVDLAKGDAWSFVVTRAAQSRMLMHVAFLDPDGREIAAAARLRYRLAGARVTLGPYRAATSGVYVVQLTADARDGAYEATSTVRVPRRRTYHLTARNQTAVVDARRGAVLSLKSVSRTPHVGVAYPGTGNIPSPPDAATLASLRGGGLSVGESGVYRFATQASAQIDVVLVNPPRSAPRTLFLPPLPQDGGDLGDQWYWNEGWRPSTSDAPPLAAAIVATIGQGKPLELGGLDVVPPPADVTPADPAPTPVVEPEPQLPPDVAADLDGVVLDPRVSDPRWSAWNYDGMGRGFLLFYAYDAGLRNGAGFASSRWFWGGSGIDQPKAPRGGGLPPFGVPEPWQLSSKFQATSSPSGPVYVLTLVDDVGPVTGRYVMRALFFLDGRVAPAPIPGSARIDDFEIRWTDEGAGEAFGEAWTQKGEWRVRGRSQLPRSAAAYTPETSYLFTDSEVLDGAETYFCGDIAATSSSQAFTAYQMECAPYSYDGAVTSSVASPSLGLDESVTRAFDPRLYMGRMFNPMAVSGRRGGAEFEPYSLLVSGFWATYAVDPGEGAAGREAAISKVAWVDNRNGALAPSIRIKLFSVDGLRLGLEGIE
jgi:hypothetical protein